MSILSDYIEGAVSTESTIPEVKVNAEILTKVLAMHIATGNILDQIKKHAFYGRDYNYNLIDDNLVEVAQTLKTLVTYTFEDLEQETILDINPRVFHAILGTATEAVELLEALEYTGGEMDLVNIGEEYGDLNWYQAIFCDTAGIEWEVILDTNAEKLYKANKARYKDGFTNGDANERNLTDEYDVLSSNLNKKSS